MTDLENLYHHAIQRVRLYPCCFSGAKRDYPVFALYPPEYQYYSHQIADCGGWYRGTEMRLIGLDGCGNFYGLHCSGEVHFYKHADKSSTTLAKSEKEFLVGIREIENQTISMPNGR